MSEHSSNEVCSYGILHPRSLSHGTHSHWASLEKLHLEQLSTCQEDSCISS